MAKMWNPWRGCHKISSGCQNCYIYKGDSRKGMDTNQIVKTSSFYLPIETKKNGSYKIPSNQLIYVCFSSDFLLEEADDWRTECFQMMKQRQDLTFLFLTKRIERLATVLPEDWEDGYDNVVVGVSVENQKNVDQKLRVLSQLPIKHKNIILQPLIEAVNIRPYLEDIDLVVVGGEYGQRARPLHYDWVLDIRNQCISHNVPFQFRQCGTYFVKDGQEYKLTYKQLTEQAKKANINTTKI